MSAAPKRGPDTHPPGGGADWLVGAGEVTELIRAKDWALTPLGPLDGWPESLRTSVSLIVASSFPINLIWGDGAVQIWNDAYSGVCGEKHPAMFGSDYRECWASAWPAIGGAFDAAREGRTAFLENQAMFLDRNGYLEETWFTFSLSPIRDERGEIAGLFHPVTETSGLMLAERRTRALRDLSSPPGHAPDVAAAIAHAIGVLGDTACDVPLALIYLADAHTGEACLRGQCGVDAGHAISERRIALDSDAPVAVALRGSATVAIDDVATRYGALPVGEHGDPLDRALVVPITWAGTAEPSGALVLGIATRVPFDEAYRGFLDLVAQGVTAALNGARAYEHERARADALAELDLAKTAFFSNVSHEFRTPLTLMLGPLEDELAESLDSPVRTERLSMVHRNGMRLLRLVNSLLDFSRLESGRVDATFVGTDLAAFTADLAGLFRYAVESVGLTYTIDCRALPETMFVDRDMWEKVVLNLISNALKHTFAGEIAISLRWQTDHAELVVRDTGIGIAAEELPRLFDRFHRVRQARARTIEGSGIGLALVKELAGVHGGTVEVRSEPGHGTAFTVTARGGTGHLRARQVRDGDEPAHASGMAIAQADETLRWLGRDAVGEAGGPAGASDGARERILVVDDNADMRRHIVRVLQGHFDVETAVDGELALASALADPPDVVLTDVMMPRLDGFGLLAALRRDDRTRTIPVIMLSARAGEEASFDGIRAGVDDYLAKPFSAQELVARVTRCLANAELRREAEQRLAMTNGKLHQALRELEAIARTDALTGLPNRRTWDLELPVTLARAKRGDHAVCVAVLDIDRFKTFNDTFGHLAGDVLLRDAGAAWQDALRDTDVIARLGGDEFGVLLPGCPLDLAESVLRRACAAMPHDATCSSGVACWDGAETAEQLVARADSALYVAKQRRHGTTIVAS